MPHRLCKDCRYYRPLNQREIGTDRRIIVQACFLLENVDDPVTGKPITYMDCSTMRLSNQCGWEGTEWLPSEEYLVRVGAGSPSGVDALTMGLSKS